MLFETIKDVALLSSPTGEEKLVQDYVTKFVSSFFRKVEIDNAGNIWVNRGKIYLCAHMDKKGEPGQWREESNTIQGRLDDAVGVGVVLNLLKENESLSALFTVAEESRDGDSSWGAQQALENMKKMAPHLIVVVDTSPRCEMNKGPILYTSSSDVRFDDVLIQKVVHIAHKESIPLQLSEGRSNDSRIFGVAGLPTFALEPHINNYHSPDEISSKSDIINLCELIRKIIE